MLDPGRYPARANGGELGHTKDNKPQIAVGFDLVDQDGNPTGQGITWFGYFSDKTAQRTIEALRHCGWRGDDLTDLAGLGDNVVELVVEHDTYEGKTSAKVRWVNALGGSGRVKLERPMDDAQKRMFAASMKTLAASIGGGRPAAPKLPPAATPKPANGDQRPAADDDSLPF